MILVPDGTLSGAEATILLETFTVSDVLDDRYDMPLLMKVGKVLLIKPEVIPRPLESLSLPGSVFLRRIFYSSLTLSPTAGFLLSLR